MTTRTATAALAAALLLAGCGGGGASYDDTAALADALGCGDTHELDDADTLSLGAKETATCDAESGRDYSLAVFRDDDTRDAFVEGVGALGGAFVVGDGWAVGASSVDDAERAADELEGELVD